MEAKKTPKADLTNKSGMFLNLGLAVSVAVVLFAFEYKSYDDGALKDLGTVDDAFEELLDIPITEQPDRKSTRLNSSHVRISYAVFCLKKKKQIHIFRTI